jgi:hypothetical protein
MRIFSFCLFLLLTAFIYTSEEFDNLKLNEIQVIGSHNSYKQSIDPSLFDYLSKTDSAAMSTIDYEHLPLSQQLDLGLLNLEIDVYADPKGGKYSKPAGLELVKEQPAFDTEKVMNQPGFKVFHIPDIDFRSNCLTFKNCLQELKDWSDKHPDHYPVFITINAKDEEVKKEGFVVPQKFTPSTFDSLDAEIKKYLGRENLITPDMVRGKYATLESAVLHGNWPLIKNVKGKFLFVLDETGHKIATYIKGHPSLRGRVLFTNSKPRTPEAAIMILNNAKKDSIRSMVKKGYIVRTRADADTKEARNNDRSAFEASCMAGAQIITTDYYQKSTHFNSDYIISFTGNRYLRANPVFSK